MTKTLEQVAAAIGAEVVGDPQRLVEAVRPLESAGARDIAFISEESRKAPDLSKVEAAALIVGRKFDDPALPDSVDLLRVDAPKLAWALALEFLHPDPAPPFSGQSDAAFICDSAEVADDAIIGPGVFVGERAMIEAGVVLYPGTYVGSDVRIGQHTDIRANVTLYDHTVIGAHCLIHAGCVLGSDGFGFAVGPRGAHKVPHRGRCIIEDHCELGANCAIDRGALDDTIIKTGTKFDNLVHVAHNCHIGPHALFAGQVGLAGSATVGMGVQLGGQVGIGGHITVGDGTRVGGKSGVPRDAAPGSRLLGMPAMDQRVAARAFAIVAKLPELRAQLVAMEERLARLEGGQE